ncbi:MAG: hypothetical protein M1275_02320 [Patescibacteria group bacterium]|nr:hypothetical protein [Patescibacteria group bacterium]
MSWLFVFGGLVLGIAVGYFLRRAQAGYLINSAEARAQKTLEEARTKERELLLSAKTKALEITEQAKKKRSRISESNHQYRTAHGAPGGRFGKTCAGA